MIDYELHIPKFPGGRFREDGPSSAEALRDDTLIPILASGAEVTVCLDECFGLPPSYAEELFGGVVRSLGAGVQSQLLFKGSPDKVAMVQEFMRDAADELVRGES